MIYIHDITQIATVTFARTVAATPERPVLELVGTVDRQRYAIPVSDFSATALYLSMRADFSAVKAPGEYEYRLTDGELVLASGIIRLGADPADPPIQYVTQLQYEQYNA